MTRRILLACVVLLNVGSLASAVEYRHLGPVTNYSHEHHSPMGCSQCGPGQCGPPRGYVPHRCDYRYQSYNCYRKSREYQIIHRQNRRATRALRGCDHCY